MKPSAGVMGSAYTPTEALSSMAARALFYPSLLYNVTRSSLQSDWHWFDEITEVTRTSAARAMPGPVTSPQVLSSDELPHPPKRPDILTASLVPQHVLLGALPFQSMLTQEFVEQARSILSGTPRLLAMLPLLRPHSVLVLNIYRACCSISCCMSSRACGRS